MGRKKKGKQKSKEPSQSLSISYGYFYCPEKGHKLPAHPDICKRCKKRCKRRDDMIMALSSVVLSRAAPTPPPTKVEPNRKSTYIRERDKKAPERKAMEIALDSYEEE